ncbi:hypothetical protein ACFLYQ_01250 [Chloroflexota bacterium]
MDETEEIRQINPKFEELAVKRAKQRAYAARWNLDIAVFAFAVLIIVVILLSQEVSLEIVAPVAVFGLSMVWLAGWWQGRQLYRSYFEEELTALGRDLSIGDNKSVDESIEEIIQKALKDRWR